MSTRTISSNLNDFYNPNLVESSTCKCLRCAYSYEDSLHFFFHCQYYNPQRISLLRYINDHDIPKDIYSVLNGNDCRPTCISLRKYLIFFYQVHKLIKNKKQEKILERKLNTMFDYGNTALHVL